MRRNLADTFILFCAPLKSREENSKLPQTNWTTSVKIPISFSAVEEQARWKLVKWLERNIVLYIYLISRARSNIYGLGWTWTVRKQTPTRKLSCNIVSFIMQWANIYATEISGRISNRWIHNLSELCTSSYALEHTFLKHLRLVLHNYPRSRQRWPSRKYFTLAKISTIGSIEL